jgi:hypothetical protein
MTAAPAAKSAVPSDLLERGMRTGVDDLMWKLSLETVN